jgi:hypothetical protein
MDRHYQMIMVGRYREYPVSVKLALSTQDESDIGQSGQITGTSTRLTARKISISGNPTLT